MTNMFEYDSLQYQLDILCVTTFPIGWKNENLEIHSASMPPKLLNYFASFSFSTV